jgi:hypothetical protein
MTLTPLGISDDMVFTRGENQAGFQLQYSLGLLGSKTHLENISETQKFMPFGKVHVQIVK